MVSGPPKIVNKALIIIIKMLLMIIKILIMILKLLIINLCSLGGSFSGNNKSADLENRVHKTMETS